MLNYMVEIHIVKKKLDVSPAGVGKQVSKDTDSHNRLFTSQTQFESFIMALEQLIAGAK